MVPRRHTYPKSHRLGGKPRFSAVFDARVKDVRGPLTFFALPNDLGHGRLGMSVSRKVGGAPRRNRVKRLLREAFRFLQHDFPRGYDLVVVVRPHEPLMLAEYQKLLSGALGKLHGMWVKRATAAEARPPTSPRVEG